MGHENPIQFVPQDASQAKADKSAPHANAMRPAKLDLKRDEALTVVWQDGSTSVYPVGYLRKMSPSAEARLLRDELAKNPLAVLPNSRNPSEPLTVTDAQFVGNYAINFTFSDGHHTGIYTWAYLYDIDPQRIRDHDGSDDDTQ